MSCIRQVNLDARWGREVATVGSTKRAVYQMLKIWNELGVKPMLPALGPFPIEDIMGVNVYSCSEAGTEDLHTVRGDSGMQSLPKCPTHSLWFKQFTKGCLSQMG